MTNQTDEVEQYRALLDARNGYCSCPDLNDLFDKRKKAQALEKMCNHLGSEAEFENPQPSDRAFLEQYGLKVDELNENVEIYYTALNDLMLSKRLKLILHDPKTRSQIGTIKYEDARDLLNSQKHGKHDVVITVHCSNCDQQIDLAD